MDMTNPRRMAELGRHPLQPMLAQDCAFGAHAGPLGLAFARDDTLLAAFRGGVFVGRHGSGNRSESSGDKAIVIRFANGDPAGPSRDILTGFVTAAGRAQRLPVGMGMDPAGGLPVADAGGDAA